MQLHCARCHVRERTHRYRTRLYFAIEVVIWFNDFEAGVANYLSGTTVYRADGQDDPRRHYPNFGNIESLLSVQLLQDIAPDTSGYFDQDVVAVLHDDEVKLLPLDILLFNSGLEGFFEHGLHGFAEKIIAMNPPEQAKARQSHFK